MCPGGNVPIFGRIFLKLKCTDITQNTYTRIWTITEVMVIELYGLLAVPRTVLLSRDVLPVHCACPSFSLQPGQAHSRCDWYQKLLLLQLIVRILRNAFWVFPCGILWHAFCVWILQWECTCCCWRIPRRFPTEGFHLGVYFLVFTRQCVRLVVFRVLLCSLKGKWCHWLTHERTFLRWFREVHDCPLVELPLASACHLCRCGEL